MGIFQKIRESVFLPILIVFFVLSIELISISTLNILILSIQYLGNTSSLNITGSLDYLIRGFALCVGIITLMIILKWKFQQDPNAEGVGKNPFAFLITSLILFIGFLNFIMDSLKVFIQEILLLSEEVKSWPELYISVENISDLGSLIVLAILLLILIPIFEELFYRKTVILGLKRSNLGSGWLILFSSLIYALSPTLVYLVEYSDGQALWNFLIKIISGIILALVFLRTNQVKFSIIMNSLLNLTAFSNYLSIYHPDITQFREFITIILFILGLIGVFLFFVSVFEGVVALQDSRSNLPIWLNYLIDFNFSELKDIKTLIGTIFILIPIIPVGIYVFIDHTILYNDIGGVIAKAVLRLSSLSCVALVSVIGIKSNQRSFLEKTKLNSSLKPMILDYINKMRYNTRTNIRMIPSKVFQHLGFIFFIIGIVFPPFIISMAAKGIIQIAIIFWAETTIEMTFSQSPFFSYSRVYTESLSTFYFLGVQRTTIESFYFLKHTNGKWYFLPDTFMAHPGDWIHGLLTVGTWFLFFGLLLFAVREYINNRKLTAGVTILGAIITEVLWLLLTFGLGSIPAERDQSGPSINQTFSQIVQADFQFLDFLFLPIGLFALLMAVLILLVVGIRQRRRRKKSFTPINSKTKENESDETI
ncbi:MAG: type II CAAX prenyl endopeptidase Rce1 family protein [Candidatus Hermodarchaeota archaeon]